MRATLIWLALLLGLATGWGWWMRPDAPPPATPPRKASPAAATLPEVNRLSVCGVSLTDSWESALVKLGPPDQLEADCARWDRPSPGRVVLRRQGNDLSIEGPRLELDGRTLAKEFDEAGGLEKALGARNLPGDAVWGWGWSLPGGMLVARPVGMCGMYRGPGIYASFTLSEGSLQPKLK